MPTAKTKVLKELSDNIRALSTKIEKLSSQIEKNKQELTNFKKQKQVRPKAIKSLKGLIAQQKKQLQFDKDKLANFQQTYARIDPQDGPPISSPSPAPKRVNQKIPAKSAETREAHGMKKSVNSAPTHVGISPKAAGVYNQGKDVLKSAQQFVRKANVQLKKEAKDAQRDFRKTRKELEKNTKAQERIFGQSTSRRDDLVKDANVLLGNKTLQSATERDIAAGEAQLRRAEEKSAGIDSVVGAFLGGTSSAGVDPGEVDTLMRMQQDRLALEQKSAKKSVVKTEELDDDELADVIVKDAFAAAELDKLLANAPRVPGSGASVVTQIEEDSALADLEEEEALYGGEEDDDASELTDVVDEVTGLAEQVDEVSDALAQPLQQSSDEEDAELEKELRDLVVADDKLEQGNASSASLAVVAQSHVSPTPVVPADKPANPKPSVSVMTASVQPTSLYPLFQQEDVSVPVIQPVAQSSVYVPVYPDLGVPQAVVEESPKYTYLNTTLAPAELPQSSSEQVHYFQPSWSNNDDARPPAYAPGYEESPLPTVTVDTKPSASPIPVELPLELPRSPSGEVHYFQPSWSNDDDARPPAYAPGYEEYPLPDSKLSVSPNGFAPLPIERSVSTTRKVIQALDKPLIDRLAKGSVSYKKHLETLSKNFTGEDEQTIKSKYSSEDDDHNLALDLQIIEIKQVTEKDKDLEDQNYSSSNGNSM